MYTKKFIFLFFALPFVLFPFSISSQCVLVPCHHSKYISSRFSAFLIFLFFLILPLLGKAFSIYV